MFAVPLSQKTRIGIIVNSLRKAADNQELTSLAKVLIKQWKKLLEAEKSEWPCVSGGWSLAVGELSVENRAAGGRWSRGGCRLRWRCLTCSAFIGIARSKTAAWGGV